MASKYLYNVYLYPDIMVDTVGVLYQNNNTSISVPVKIQFNGQYLYANSIGKFIEGELKLTSENFFFDDTIVLLYSEEEKGWKFHSKFVKGQFIHNPNVISEYSLGRPYLFWGQRSFESGTITFLTQNNSWYGFDAFILSYPANTIDEANKISSSFAHCTR